MIRNPQFGAYTIRSKIKPKKTVSILPGPRSYMILTSHLSIWSTRTNLEHPTEVENTWPRFRDLEHPNDIWRIGPLEESIWRICKAHLEHPVTNIWRIGQIFPIWSIALTFEETRAQIYRTASIEYEPSNIVDSSARIRAHPRSKTRIAFICFRENQSVTPCGCIFKSIRVFIVYTGIKFPLFAYYQHPWQFCSATEK